ncbi:hypothetical protein [Massilia sp. BJB1822]|uniref:hypothetical protein n=1 Tax=Massilia sp. BJB1822 TaxID=2744470 RepID=UPI00159357E7|nr:hypothetical protein [Massilia sp. BJB1822]NVD97740.1 hypothetical protein [Massilia sp. BJB1822]
MKRLIFIASLFVSICLPASAQVADSGKQQIEGIIEAFRTAIINKDKEKFMQLFLREEITWITSVTERSRDLTMARHGNKPRPPKIDVPGTPREFIGAIAARSERSEETFDNVRIDTDGEVAQVWFDYVFKLDDYAGNWGKEAWQLVRTDAGWKIVSIIWSTELNPVPPPRKL